MSLAVADVIVATFRFPFKAIASGLRRWPFSYNFSQFVGCIQLLWVGASICTLILTAVNRYFCVVKPQRYSIFFSRKKATVSIVLVWLVMCVISFTFREDFILKWVFIDSYFWNFVWFCILSSFNYLSSGLALIMFKRLSKGLLLSQLTV